MKGKRSLASKKPGRPAHPKTLFSPLIEAAAKGDVHQIEKLFQLGADVNQPSDPKSPRYYGADALIMASQQGQLQAAAMLLKHGARVTNCSGYGTALEQAIDHGHVDVVRLLLKHGAREVGFSLFNALEQGNVEIFRALLESGIHLHKFRSRLTKQSLLERAIERRRSEIVSFLLEVDVTLGGGELVQCAARGNAELARRLIAKGADPNKENRTKRYPLCAACYWGNKEVVNVLLEHGANVTVVDVRGWSCLDWAKYGKRKEIVSWLRKLAKEKGVKIPETRGGLLNT